MNKEQTFEEIVDTLNQQKNDFLSALESSIKIHIKQKSTPECLTLVSRDSNGRTLFWYPKEGMPYVQRLIAFMRGKKHQGKDIDSALTDEVVELVSKQFNTLYMDNQELITTNFSQALLDHVQVQEAFRNLLSNTKALRYASSAIKSKVINLLFGSLKSQTYDVAGVVAAKAAAGTGAALSVAVSIPIVKSLLSKLTMLLASKLQVLLVKMLAIPAVKKIVMVIAKKFVIATLAGSLIKLIVVKTGLSVGAVFALILLPIIAVILAHEWATFPEKLAQEVSEGVRGEVNQQYNKINLSIVGELFDTAIDIVVEDLHKWVQDDPEIEDQLAQLVAIVEVGIEA
jgi:hypothetical protein